MSHLEASLGNNTIYDVSLNWLDWFVCILGLGAKYVLHLVSLEQNISECLILCIVADRSRAELWVLCCYLGIIGSEGCGLTDKINWKSLHHLLVLMVHYIHHFSVKSHQHLELGIQTVDQKNRHKTFWVQIPDVFSIASSLLIPSAG